MNAASCSSPRAHVQRRATWPSLLMKKVVGMPPAGQIYYASVVGMAFPVQPSFPQERGADHDAGEKRRRCRDLSGREPFLEASYAA